MFCFAIDPIDENTADIMNSPEIAVNVFCDWHSYLYLCYTGVSIDEIAMAIVVDGDVITGRKRRNIDIERMQELICTPVSVLCVCENDVYEAWYNYVWHSRIFPEPIMQLVLVICKQNFFIPCLSWWRHCQLWTTRRCNAQWRTSTITGWCSFQRL